jgi:hypothetical protein
MTDDVPRGRAPAWIDLADSQWHHRPVYQAIIGGPRRAVNTEKRLDQARDRRIGLVHAFNRAYDVWKVL